MQSSLQAAKCYWRKWTSSWDNLEHRAPLLSLWSELLQSYSRTFHCRENVPIDSEHFVGTDATMMRSDLGQGLDGLEAG